MKKILVLLLAILFLYSCEYNQKEFNDLTDDMATTRSLEAVEYKDEPYTFKKVTDPTVWRTYNNLEEMLKACQLPEEMIKIMSTENLIHTLMSHPLYFIYSAYNNEFDGVNVVLDNFNGFQALIERDSIAEKIIDYYARLDVEEAVETTKKSVIAENLTIYHLDFLELVIATKKIPEIFNQQYIDRFEKTMNEKYEAKLSHNKEIGMFSIRKSLMLGAEIKLSKNVLDPEDQKMLNDFIKSGGMVSENTLYTKISEIIFLK